MTRSRDIADQQENLGGAVAPFVAGKNKIINGDFAIDQRNNGASLTPTAVGPGQYNLDRWASYCSQASKISIQQNAGAVTPPSGFGYYAGVTSLAATTVGSSDYFIYAQNIEGFNTASLGWGTASAKTITISFWVRSSLTGTFGGVVTNNVQNRTYAFTYGIASANTWEQKSVTIAGDTSGTWQRGSSTGIFMIFGLGTGSAQSTAAGSWGTSSALSASGSVNFVSTNGATWYITGVQLEQGNVATPFTTASGSIGGELALCQRYYYRNTPGTGYGIVAIGGVCFSSTTALFGVQFPVTMRIYPTSADFSNLQLFDSGNTQYSLSAVTVSALNSGTSISGFEITASGLTAGRPCVLRQNNNSAGYLGFSAEL
jgi:hypothetical protein